MIAAWMVAASLIYHGDPQIQPPPIGMRTMDAPTELRLCQTLPSSAFSTANACVGVLLAGIGNNNNHFDPRIPAVAYLRLGVAYRLAGYPGDAANQFRHAIRLSNLILSEKPDDDWALEHRCKIRAIAGIDVEAGLADCEQGLALKPGDIGLQNMRAYALYSLGRFQEALAGYDKALAQEPGQAGSLFMRGVVKRRLGDTAGAQADVTAARAIRAEVEEVCIDTGLQTQ